MKQSTSDTAEDIQRQPEIHTVWINEEEHIASFHAVEGYAVQEQTFAAHESFMQYLRSLQECGFRFQ